MSLSDPSRQVIAGERLLCLGQRIVGAILQSVKRTGSAAKAAIAECKFRIADCGKSRPSFPNLQSEIRLPQSIVALVWPLAST